MGQSCVKRKLGLGGQHSAHGRGRCEPTADGHDKPGPPRPPVFSADPLPAPQRGQHTLYPPRPPAGLVSLQLSPATLSDSGAGGQSCPGGSRGAHKQWLPHGAADGLLWTLRLFMFRPAG